MATIGVDVKINADGAVSGGRVATASLDSIEKSADKATKSTSNLNGMMGQAGYQIADFASQIQYGGNVLGAFGVQGGQLLAVLNPMAGAFLTVAGIVGGQYLMSTGDATDSTEALEKAIEGLGATISIGSDGVATFSAQIERLSATNERAARAQIALAVNQTVDALNAANDTVSESISSLDSWTNNLANASTQLDDLDAVMARTGMTASEALDVNEQYASSTIVLSGYVAELSNEFGISTDQALSLTRALSGFNQDRSPEALQALADSVNAVNEATGFSNRELVEFAQVINEGSLTAAQYTQVMGLLQSSLTDLDGVISANNDSFVKQQSTIDGLSQNLIVLQMRISGNSREAAIQEAVFRSGAEAGSDYATQISLLAGQQYDLQQQLKTTNTSIKEFDQDGAYLEKLEKQADAIGLNAREQAMLRAEYALSEKATDTQIEQARQLAGQLYDATAEQKRQDDITRTFRNTVEGLNPSVDNYVIRMAALTEAHNQGYISAQQLSAEMVKVQQSFNPDSITFAESFNLQFQETVEGAQNMEASLGEIYGNTFSTLSSSIGQATTDMLLFGASGEDAARQVAQAVAGQLISSLVELGVQYTLNAALGETIAAASLAATSASAAAMGAVWATPAALASLATLGTNSAPATAAVTGTVAAAQGVALAGSAIPGFAEGGLAYGPGTGTSDSFTANLSNGEFVMPQRETMRNLGTLQSMRAGNDVTSGGSPVKVNVVNQTTGRVDSASAEWVSRDELTVILAEEVPGIVAGEFNDEYSKTNRAFNSSYVTQRKF